jgi:hypothetical protein
VADDFRSKTGSKRVGDQTASEFAPSNRKRLADPSDGEFGATVSDSAPAESRKRGGGGKLSRSETVTVRLDPKLRYLAELAARKHRRTLSSFIEWVIEESLKNIWLADGEPSIASQSAELWDVDEPDRFAKLAIRYPDMLTHDEQVLWKLIRENGSLWRGHYDKETKEWTWQVRQNFLIFERLRKSWEVFRSVAYENGSKDRLPTWKKVDDEIPF